MKTETLSIFELCDRFIAETSLFTQESVAVLNLNATDAKCIDVMRRFRGTPVTAGMLARDLNLTTGAITGVIDRLEKMKLVQRTRDKTDRRKIYIELGEACLTKLNPRFRKLEKALNLQLKKFSKSDIDVIRKFLIDGTLIIEKARQNQIDKK